MSVLDLVDFSQVTTDGNTFAAGSSGDALVACQLLSGLPAAGGAERYLNDQGWLKVSSLSTGPRRFTVTYPLGRVAGFDISKVYYLGYRYKKQLVNVTAGTTWPAELMLFDNVNWNGGNMVALLNNTDAGFGGHVDLLERYIEVRLDLPGKTYTVWVDGKQIKTGTLPTWINTIISTNLWVMLGGNYTSNNPAAGTVNTWFKDIYVKRVDSVDDDFRLGSQTVLPLTLSSASGAEWTPSDGSSVSAVLNSPTTLNSQQAAPTITSGANKLPLEVGFATPGTVGKINAVAFSTSALKPAGTTTSINAVLVEDDTLSAVKNLALGPTLQIAMPINLLTKTPKGNALTAANIAALKLRLTPANS